jgi:two-component system nitrogen regulation response regulator GlnG
MIEEKTVLRGLLVIDIISMLSNNPALFFVGAFMSFRLTSFNVLLFSSDNGIQAQYKELFGEQAVTIGRDGLSVPKDAAKRTFDAVIVESKSSGAGEISKFLAGFDPARTLTIWGSRTVLKRAAAVLAGTKVSKSPPANGAAESLCLESFLEHKVGDFVKGMRHGSGRNLHPMLIAAVERPLITLTLRETKGNQIQAAELLGLNRNTLRKKIVDLHIPVKRARVS